MLASGSNPTLVTAYLHNRNFSVKPRDVHNMKLRLKFQGTPTEEIKSVLDKPHIQYVIDKDSSDTLQCLAFTTSDQQNLASTYGDVILLDGTYRINKHRMPLYTAAIVDSESHGQPIAHALLAREDLEHLSLFLSHLKDWVPNIDSAIFMVDKDFAEISAIRQSFPNAIIHLCRFHVLKAFMDEMKRQGCINNRTLQQVLLATVYHLY